MAKVTARYDFVYIFQLHLVCLQLFCLVGLFLPHKFHYLYGISGESLLHCFFAGGLYTCRKGVGARENQFELDFAHIALFFGPYCLDKLEFDHIPVERRVDNPTQDVFNLFALYHDKSQIIILPNSSL